MIKEHLLPKYLPLSGGIILFIPLSKVLAQCEIQTALSRIWTRISMLFSNDVNHYTLGHLYFSVSKEHKQFFKNFLVGQMWFNYSLKILLTIRF